MYQKIREDNAAHFLKLLRFTNWTSLKPSAKKCFTFPGKITAAMTYVHLQNSLEILLKNCSVTSHSQYIAGIYEEMKVCIHINRFFLYLGENPMSVF